MRDGARFPPYGKALFERRMLGERLRVCYLLVGDFWRVPKELRAALDGLPRLAVKSAPWDSDQRPADAYDWRVVQDMTVLAIDARGAGEFAESADGHDTWLWLLAEVQRHARDVLVFSPLLRVVDGPNAFAPERDLETLAWLGRTYDAEQSAWSWPRWWPHGDRIFAQRSAA